jgi:hypothetical protein
MRLKLPPRKAFLPTNPDIEFYHKLNLLSTTGLTAFTARFTNKHAYSISSGRWTEHLPTWILKGEWSLSRWAERKEPFWWSCVSKKELATMKSVPRSYMARKVRSAIVESLQKKGFNPDGTSADGTGKELHGTAQFRTEAAALTLPFAQVVKQTDTAIERIIKGIQIRDDRFASWKKGVTYGEGRSYGGKRDTRFDQRSTGQSTSSTSGRKQTYKKVQKPREVSWGRPIDEV